MAIPLSAFVSQCGNSLPQVVAVAESYYGICSGSLTEGQLLQVHFLKETKAISAQVSGVNNVVPVNSSFKVTIPYDAPKAANEGLQFATVSDLVKAKPMPSVVYVGQSWSSKGSLSVQAGQVLILKGVKEHSKKSKRLICIDVKSKNVLKLDEHCEGHFTTQPFLASFHIMDLLAHFKLPVKAAFISSNHRQMPCVIKERITFQSIIASFFSPSQDERLIPTQEVPNEVVEIISTVPIDIRIVNVSEKDMTNLRMARNLLAETLTPELVTDVVTTTIPSVDSFQKDLLVSVEADDWKKELKNIEDNKDHNVDTQDDLITLEDEYTYVCFPNDTTSEATHYSVHVTASPPPPLPPRPQLQPLIDLFSDDDEWFTRNNEWKEEMKSKSSVPNCTNGETLDFEALSHTDVNAQNDSSLAVMQPQEYEIAISHDVVQCGDSVSNSDEYMYLSVPRTNGSQEKTDDYHYVTTSRPPPLPPRSPSRPHLHQNQPLIDLFSDDDERFTRNNEWKEEMKSKSSVPNCTNGETLDFEALSHTDVNASSLVDMQPQEYEIAISVSSCDEYMYMSVPRTNGSQEKTDDYHRPSPLPPRSPSKPPRSPSKQFDLIDLRISHHTEQCAAEIGDSENQFISNDDQSRRQSLLLTTINSLENSNQDVLRENKLVICNYTVDEIAYLLEMMSLGKYKEKFVKEQIDGSLFFELDDSILENELGVSLKLHRIKLMCIIDGRHSVNKYLT